MATVGSSLIQYFLSKSAITALVGQRILPDVPAQAGTANATMPYIVVQQVRNNRLHSIEGMERLAKATFEIAIFADSRSSANAVLHAIRTCGIGTYRGVTDSIWFQSAKWENEQHGYEPPIDGSAKSRYLSVFDLTINYQEAT